jgi:predicted porin
MFKKTLAAVAVGMVAFGAQAAEFKIGDDVVFQANFDLLAEIANKKEAVDYSSNMVGVGQIQLRATKNLTPDFSVFGQIEVDFDPSVNNAPALADDSRIGLASKEFGTLAIGQFDSFMEDNIAEAITVIAHAESAAFVTEPKIGNKGRQIEYRTPKFGGFFGVAAASVSTKDAAGSEQSMGTNFVLGYDLNGLKVFIGQSDLPKFADAFADAAWNIKKVRGLAASYKFGDTTVAVSSFASTSTTDYDTGYAGIGVGHVMGPWDFSLTLQNVNTVTSTANTTATQWALGTGYTITKGTVAYLNINSLGAAKNVGDLTVFGIKTSF